MKSVPLGADEIYINILVLFTPEKNLCLDNIYYIISKINSLKKQDVFSYKRIVYMELYFRMGSESSHKENVVYFFLVFILLRL